LAMVHQWNHYESLPVYAVERSSGDAGSIVVSVARKNEDGTVCFVNCLIDLWKLGLKSSFGSFSMKMREFDRLRSKMHKRLHIYSIGLEEAKWLVAQGLRLSDAVGTPSSRDWIKILGDLSSIHISGSLYKCFKCQHGELTAEIDEFILSVAREEGKKGVAGTPSERKIYFVCEKCKTKPEGGHNRFAFA